MSGFNSAISIKTKRVVILHSLGFKIFFKKHEIVSEVPSWRIDDINIPEDLIEEIARIYGYHNLPSILLIN